MSLHHVAFIVSFHELDLKGVAIMQETRVEKTARTMSAESADERACFERKAEHLLRPFEAWCLPRMARALPTWVLPDHLTALGTVAALAAGLCLSQAGHGAGFLWAANALLVLNWLGDSLDGTLARERKIERPRYGFYLDHLMDMLSVAAILCGFGLSPHLNLSIALLVIIAYYLMAINTHLQLKTFGVYEIAYNGVGPTEARLFLMLRNGALAFGLVPVVSMSNLALKALDPVALGIAASMLVVVGTRSFTNLRALALREPPGNRRKTLLLSRPSANQNSDVRRPVPLATVRSSAG
jgi:archaetidylinositol phosphate synthase